jgi:hypothetical protein|tara:strand:+ start:464 stop:874 length:411 start_codon:yes stop_codon:yes gene_type:complete
MKVYINNIDYEKLNLTFNIKNIERIIYTDEGLFYFNKAKLYKRDINYYVYEYKKNDFIFLIDNSKNVGSTEYYYIPYVSKEVIEVYYEYKISNKVKLIKKKYNNDNEYYFIINSINDINKIISFILKNNINNNKYD